ncbi:MAG: hypothetical protein IT229_08070 [Flavobacteriales bacterium]|nr:hypothetical protein [Flavobacteriales bacterium]
MRKLPIFLVALMLSAGTTKAQDYAQEPAPPPAPKEKKDPRPLKDRLYFGGGVNLSFGTVSNLGVSPMVGYKIDQKGKWSAGLIVNYNYFSDNRYTPKYESSTYGGSLFTRYRVIPQLYLHAEYNQQNYELYSPFSDQSRREWVPFLLLGGGYAQPVGGNSFITFQVLWDVIQDTRSPYGNQPWITGGVGVGF